MDIDHVPVHVIENSIAKTQLLRTMRCRLAYAEDEAVCLVLTKPIIIVDMSGLQASNYGFKKL